MAERIDQRDQQTATGRDELDALSKQPVFPPATNLPTDSNPVPESPTDPMHRTSTGDTGAPDDRDVIPVVPVGPANTGGGGTGGATGIAPIGGVVAADTLDDDDGRRRDDDVVRHDNEGAV